MNIPKQYLPIMPYLVVNNARQFADFMKTVFGATEQMIMPTADNKIMHGELRIQDAVIMFADAGDKWKQKTAALYLCVDANTATQLYNRALENEAKSLQTPEKREYGFSAGVEDPFGNQWFMVEHGDEIKP